MPDVTMCSNSNCKFRKDCYRYRAKPDKYQSYSEFHPFENECTDFWDTRDYLPSRLRTVAEVDAELNNHLFDFDLDIT